MCWSWGSLRRTPGWVHFRGDVESLTGAEVIEVVGMALPCMQTIVFIKCSMRFWEDIVTFSLDLDVSLSHGSTTSNYIQLAYIHGSLLRVLRTITLLHSSKRAPI
jgi:hypothetical protein